MEAEFQSVQNANLFQQISCTLLFSNNFLKDRIILLNKNKLYKPRTILILTDMLDKIPTSCLFNMSFIFVTETAVWNANKLTKNIDTL